MIRSALALVLSMSVTAPAFAQQSDGDRTWDAITQIKEKITAYDQGTGTALAYYGGKITKWSFIALGTAAAADAFVVPGSVYYKWPLIQRATSPFREPFFVNAVKTVGTPAAAVGVTLLGVSAVVFAAQHLWYGVAGQPHPAALTPEQQQLAAFFQQPTETIYAQAQQDPELAQKIVELNDSLTVVEGVGYAK